MDGNKPKGFGEFDKLARKLVKVPPGPPSPPRPSCNRCGHDADLHHGIDLTSASCCEAEGCDCKQYIPPYFS